MGFLDKIKDAGQKAGKTLADEYKQHQENRAELKELRGQQLCFINAQYVGGFGAHKPAKGILTFFQKRTEFKAVFDTSFVLENEDITELAIEGRSEVSSRVTVTRLLAVGIFAFAFKKKNEDKESFITITLLDGQEVVFHIVNVSPLDLKRKLANAVSNVKQVKARNPKSDRALSVADELGKLAELKEQGILTDAEFTTEKEKLLKR